jgi:hypothetical protein
MKSDLILALGMGAALAAIAALRFPDQTAIALMLAPVAGPLVYLALAFSTGAALGARDAFGEVTK